MIFGILCCTPSRRRSTVREHIAKHTEQIIHIARSVFKMKFSVHIRTVSAKRIARITSASERIAASRAKSSEAAKSCILRLSCRLCRESFLQSCKAEFIVELTLFVITQYIVGFRHILEHLLCMRITRVRIRMVLLCKLTICFLDG